MRRRETLTYDIGPRPRRSVPWGSVLLLVGVVAVAALLITWVAASGRPASPSGSAGQATSAPSAPTDVVSPPPPGTDANEEVQAPPGSQEAASRFVLAWLNSNSSSRRSGLQQVAVPALTEGLMLTAPGNIPHATPTGGPVLEDASTYSAQFTQTLSNKTRIRIYLVADPAARYGWLATSVDQA